MKIQNTLKVSLLLTACGYAGMASANSGWTRPADPPVLAAELPSLATDPLNPSEVSQLYAGKTWYWKSTPAPGQVIAGAAYFAPNDTCRMTLREYNPPRVNRAVSCTWSAHEYGSLIIEAYWRSSPSRGFFNPSEWRHSRISFTHQRDAKGNIFQRKADCGGDLPWNGYSWDHTTACAATLDKWYVFKHAVPAKADGWWKVMAGDHTPEVMRWN